MRCCVLISSRNGERTIEVTVQSALATGVPVYVVSDGSTDGTAELARKAGATVLELVENVGKPAALRRGFDEFSLESCFEWVAVVDDDTTLAPDFCDQASAHTQPGVAIVVGQTRSAWKRSGWKHRWNVWVAGRAYAYWKYQLLIRRGQSALNVMTCISGSNSAIRSSVLAQILGPTPYIVDDTYWTLEVHRRKLGRIVYAPKAVAWVQDPTTLDDWYRQNLRWLWGTVQGVLGHRVGRQRTAFDVWYVALILDWAMYLVGWPALLLLGGVKAPQLALAWGVGYGAWVAAAAIATRRPAMLFMAPVLVLTDFLYRVVFLHAIVKGLRHPTVETCRWVSPTRTEVSI